MRGEPPPSMGETELVALEPRPARLTRHSSPGEAQGRGCWGWLGGGPHKSVQHTLVNSAVGLATAVGWILVEVLHRQDKGVHWQCEPTSLNRWERCQLRGGETSRCLGLWDRVDTVMLGCISLSELVEGCASLGWLVFLSWVLFFASGGREDQSGAASSRAFLLTLLSAYCMASAVNDWSSSSSGLGEILIRMFRFYLYGFCLFILATRNPTHQTIGRASRLAQIVGLLVGPIQLLFNHQAGLAKSLYGGTTHGTINHAIVGHALLTAELIALLSIFWFRSGKLPSAPRCSHVVAALGGATAGPDSVNWSSGFCTVIVVALAAISHVLDILALALLSADTLRQLPYSTLCQATTLLELIVRRQEYCRQLDDSLLAGQGRRDQLYGLSCAAGWVVFAEHLLVVPMLLFDLLMHRYYWNIATRRAVAAAFGDQPYGLYIIDPEELIEDELIGAGAESAVYKAFSSRLRGPDSDEQACVAKKPHGDGEKGLASVLQEARVLAYITDKGLSYAGRTHIVQFYGFCATFPKVAVVLQYCAGGDLLKRLLSMYMSADDDPAAARASLTQRIEWALQVARGLEYLHSCRVAHMDIKAQNVLLDDGGLAYLADFGVSVIREEPDRSSYLQANMGTAAFQAPEVKAEHSDSVLNPLVKYDPFRADVYSFGFVLYVCLTFQLEPCQCSVDQATNMIEYGTELSRDDATGALMLAPEELGHLGRLYGPEVCQALFGLMRETWLQSPEERPTAVRCVQVLEEWSRRHGAGQKGLAVDELGHDGHTPGSGLVVVEENPIKDEGLRV